MSPEASFDSVKKDADSAFADAKYIEDLRIKMLKFAQMQLDHELAEDAVQEAFAGAMKNAHKFGGKSAFSTWVFAILKNKIIDTIRKKQRRAELSQSHFGTEDGDEIFDTLFNERGAWHSDTMPKKWGEPEESFSDSRFWIVFEACLNNLPPEQGKIFMMREFIGFKSEEICEEANISTSNLHVILHRARMRLRVCLEKRWFAQD